MNALTRLTIEHLAPRIDAGEVSPVDVTQAYLDQITRRDRDLNAYSQVTADTALAEAQDAEAEIRAGRYRGPLHGVPIAVKDLYDVAGLPTTAGSKLFLDNIAHTDAPSIARLRAAGAILLGKLNMHEVAYGVTGDSSHFGPTRNPWDLTRVPGGSSGGSGAAVAARLCAAATGSDTGGSIRIPAALCGIVGLKPTYGRIPTRGLIPLSYSLDHPGPMARSVYDVGVMLQAMSGYDADDPTTPDEPVPNFLADLEAGVRGLTIALDPSWALPDAHPDVVRGLHATLDTLRHHGATVIEVSMPRLVEANTVALTILNAEATGYHEERLKTRLADFRPDVGSRLQLGFEVRGIDYGHAVRFRSFIVRDFQKLFEQVDIFIGPACAIPAPPMGVSKVELGNGTVSSREAIARYTRPFNLMGLPVLALPSGLSVEGLPVGVQLVARWWDEATLLRVGRVLEGSLPWPAPPEDGD